jgi:hypothetical protein
MQDERIEPSKHSGGWMLLSGIQRRKSFWELYFENIRSRINAVVSHQEAEDLVLA